MFVLEEVTGQGFLKEYWSILTDPAHVAVELTLMLLLDGVLLGLAWPAVRRYFNAKLKRAHEELDREHGITHHGDHVHRADETAPAPAAECEAPASSD